MPKFEWSKIMMESIPMSQGLRSGLMGICSFTTIPTSFSGLMTECQTSSMLLWSLSDSVALWESGVQACASSRLKNSFGVPCFAAQGEFRNSYFSSTTVTIDHWRTWRVAGSATSNFVHTNSTKQNGGPSSLARIATIWGHLGRFMPYAVPVSWTYPWGQGSILREGELLRVWGHVDVSSGSCSYFYVLHFFYFILIC